MSAASDFSSSTELSYGPPPSLHPKVQETFSGRKFVFSVDKSGTEHFQDVSNNGTDYEADLSAYFPSTEPVRTKAGKIAKRQPIPSSKSQKWWRAQCGFRELVMSGKTEVLQNRLRERRDKGLGSKISDVRNRMRKEYLEKNGQKIKQVWDSGSDSQKAVLWPKRFLYETLMAEPRAMNDAVVVIVEDWAESMEKAAKDLGIVYETTTPPLELYPGGVYYSGRRQVVLGNDEQAVRTKSAALRRKFAGEIKKTQQARLQREQTKEKLLKTRLDEATREGKNQKGEWNVSGEWTIHCPGIENDWGSHGSQCEMEIRYTEEKNGFLQIWADFDLNIVTGVMRFVNRNASAERGPVKSSNTLPGSYRLMLREEEADEMDEEEMEEDEYVEKVDDGTAPQFLLTKSLLPSSLNKDFQFRWRGEETGEGEIQVGSDVDVCTIQFSSPNAFKGTFICAYTGKVEFQGFKNEQSVGAGQERNRNFTCMDVNEAWNSRSEAAHARASVARWGGRRW